MTAGARPGPVSDDRASDRASGLQTGLTPVAGYQSFSPTRQSDGRDEAQQILTSGWRYAAYPVVDLGTPIPWALASQVMRSWNYHLHCFAMLDPLLVAHTHSADPAFLQPAVRIALDWVALHPRQAPDQSPMAWYDMAVGLRAARLAYICQAAAAAGLLSQAEHVALWQSLEAHRAELADDATIAFHTNHGYFQVAGQLALGRRFGAVDPGMQALYVQGVSRLHRMLDQQFGSDGVHREHSPMYHHMVLETLLGLLRAKVVDDPALWQRVTAIEHSLSWFVQPSGQLTNFGDTDSTDISLSAAQAAQHWTTDAMRAVASGGRVGGDVPAGLKTFADTGYAIIRQPAALAPLDMTQAAYLAQTAAFQSRVHKHADDLSFVWSDKGQPILTDAGRYGYVGRTEVGSDLFRDGHWYDDPMRVHMESTRAHNTLEFDGRNAPRKGVVPYGSALRGTLETDGIFAIETSCTHFRTIRHDRVLLFSPGCWLLVYDVFADRRKQPHDVRQWFHLPPGAQVAARPDGYDAVLPLNGQKLFIRSMFAQDMATAVIEGHMGSHMGDQTQGWWSGEREQAGPAPAFAFLMQDKVSGHFATLFSLTDGVTPDRVWSKANVTGRQAQFLWQDAQTRHRIILRRQDGLSISYTAARTKTQPDARADAQARP